MQSSHLLHRRSELMKVHCDSNAAATSLMSSTSSALSAISLTNPWLHTSLLYSQFYSQTLPLNSAIDRCLDSGNKSRTLQGPAPPPATTALQASSVTTCTNSSLSDKNNHEKDDKKRNHVWRPY